MPGRLLIREAREDDAEGFSRAYEASWNAAMEPLIGRTLGEIVAFEERVTRGLGAVEATLWVVEGNRRARRFYERNGWRADGETKPAYFDLTEVRYKRRL